MTLASIKASWLMRLLVLGRRISFAARFFGKPIHIHASSWVSWRSVVRVCGGGRITIGRNCQIHPFAMLLTYGGDICIGDDCSVNPFTIIYGIGGAHIGNGVRIAAHSVIVPENHNRGTDSLPITQAGSTKRGIRIEDNVWIGAGVRVLDGVVIGRNTIVGAGSVVNRSLPANVTAVGVPARTIKMEAPLTHERTSTQDGESAQ
jgi:acetyltransferase-like isoleucine patch superfamily enzyme